MPTYTSGSHNSGLLQEMIDSGEIEPHSTRRCYGCGAALEWFGEWGGIIGWHDDGIITSPDINYCANCYQNRKELNVNHNRNTQAMG